MTIAAFAGTDLEDPDLPDDAEPASGLPVAPWPKTEVDATESAVTRIPVAQLLPADSPRLTGEDESHVQVLAETGAPLPPILVHRETMRVIDGMHRLHVALLTGDTCVEARMFSGSTDDAFVEAVRANVTHGKPLTLAERQAAADRILNARPEWSDRAIAEVCGLSPRTVAGMRKRASAAAAQMNIRLGRDGRKRPLDVSEGRARASEMFREKPTASLREVAAASGISVGTVRDVRLKLEREDVVPPPVRPEPALPPVPVEDDIVADEDILEPVRNDVALRSSEEGRALLDWLEARVIGASTRRVHVDAVPLSRCYVLADIARRIAANWSAFAEDLERRARGGR